MLCRLQDRGHVLGAKWAAPQPCHPHRQGAVGQLVTDPPSALPANEPRGVPGDARVERGSCGRRRCAPRGPRPAGGGVALEDRIVGLSGQHAASGWLGRTHRPSLCSCPAPLQGCGRVRRHRPGRSRPSGRSWRCGDGLESARTRAGLRSCERGCREPGTAHRAGHGSVLRRLRILEASGSLGACSGRPPMTATGRRQVDGGSFALPLGTRVGSARATSARTNCSGYEEPWKGMLVAPAPGCATRRRRS